ncbi:aminotransferase class I/II-fold pyridoxal phosphate-dependent enzyme [Eubacteriaceae bacterium ES3]|nr:aminotransferase class I/II-fold pyridoxal phosphate-dependent enzyme [Eubacteriaceae bacterium ES3]
MKQAEMVIESSLREGGTDPIFRIAGEAAKKTSELGPEAVINSTIGALMDDEGKLITMKSVYDTLKNLPNELIAGYSGLAGQPDYLEDVVNACFKDYKPDEGFIKAVATPGGTGAIRHAFANYTEPGDQILLTDWYWAAYHTIADENRRSIVTFPLYNEQGSFNMEAYKESMKALLKKQKRVLSVLNTPAHNPTGYTITDSEWDEIIAFVTKEANDNPEFKIILLVDLAYIDFSGEGDEARAFMRKLTGMPHNVLTLYAFSCSKGYTMYGLRNGAIICVAPTLSIAEEFANACTYSNRGSWSNGTRGAMETISKIYSEPELYNQMIAEQNHYKGILRARAKAFVDEAEKVGLKIVTYSDGFFISIPCEHSREISDRLMEKNVFVVGLAKGLRFAPCAVSEEKCRRSPALILEAMNEVLSAKA